MFAAPEKVKSRYCRACLNRQLSNEGLVCELSYEPDFSKDECSKFDVDKDELERLVELEEEVEIESGKNHLAWLFIAASLMGALIYWGYSFYRNKQLSDNYRFTSAVIYEINNGFNFPYMWVPESEIKYEYLVEGVRYSDELELTGDYNDYSNLKSKSFLLLFSPKSPDNSKLVINSQISDKIIFPPQGISEDSLRFFVKNAVRNLKRQSP